MISKHIFNSDVISGNILWIDNIQSTGSLVIANDSFNVRNSSSIGENFYVGGNSELSGTLNVSKNTTLHSGLYVEGDTWINGNLQVSGDQVIMETHIVKVEDKNIELAVVETPTDVTADGGGITLKGASDKTINWANSTDSWNSSEHFFIADGKHIRTDKVRARDGAGLLLEDDGGNGIFIEDGGNVGINKANPEEKLHLNGDMLFDNGQILKWKDSLGVNRNVLQMRADNKVLLINNSTGNGGDIVFSTKAGAAESVRITNNNNVGIGTGAPDALLHLYSAKGETSQPILKLSSPDPTILLEDSSNEGDYSISWNAGISNGELSFKKGNVKEVVIDGGKIGLGKTNPLYDLDIQGSGSFSNDLIIGGNLTVNGTTTTVNSTTVSVDDKNIELGSVETPTDATANGGGITLKGASDKTINWANSTDSWNSSEHFFIADGKHIRTDKVRARDGAGLLLQDDGGNGITIADAGNVTLSHDLYVPAKIRHVGDTDTYSEFHAGNQWRVVAGNNEVIEAQSTAFNINKNTNIADGQYLKTDKVRARDGAGLLLQDDGGNGITIADGGDVSCSRDLNITGNLQIAQGTAPTNTENTLYNVGGNLLWNGEDVLHARDTITELEDTNIGTTAAGQLLIYDNTAKKWNNSTLTAGNAISITNEDSSITINHSDTSTQVSSNNSGRTYIQDVILDQYGHVTTLRTASETVVNTDEDVSVANLKTRLAGGFGGNAVSIGDSNDVITIPGSLVVTGKTTTSHVETVSTSNGVVFEGNALDNHEGTLKAETLSADRTYTLPNKSGTVAMTADITAAAPSTATSTVQGLIKLSSNTDQTVAANTVTSTAGRTYGVQLNSSNQAVVNVPWTDTQLTNQEVQDAVGGSFPTYSSSQNGQVLKVVNGNLSWQPDLDESVTNPGGSNTQVQFNNSGSFGGSANLTFDGTNLSCKGDVIAYASSDKRLKNNISNISSPIEKIKQINGVNFEWSKEQSTYSGKDIGVIAQEIDKVLPEAVSEREDGHLAVKYEKIIPLLIEAIKDQQKQIEDLESRLK